MKKILTTNKGSLILMGEMKVINSNNQFQRAMDHCRRLRLIRGLAVEGRHAHAAEADGRDVGTGLAETTGFHGRVPVS